MNQRMREIENKIEEVKQSCTRNEGEIKKVESEVVKLAAQVKRKESARESGRGHGWQCVRETERKGSQKT